MNRILLSLLLVAFLTGCATSYQASRTDPDTGIVTTINIKSYREFEGGISIIYNRDAGAFEIQAGEVSTGTSPLEEAAAAILLQSMTVIPQ
jgi:hypothetical protein